MIVKSSIIAALNEIYYGFYKVGILISTIALKTVEPNKSTLESIINSTNSDPTFTKTPTSKKLKTLTLPSK